MNIHAQKPSREQASALLITLTLGVILLIVLASYLMLLTSQKTLVSRSQTWNAAMTFAEAGIEEAMAQLNQPGAFSLTNLINGSVRTDFSNNGWGGSAVNYHYGAKTNANLPDGSYNASFYAPVATINSILTVTNAFLYSTGYVTVPITGDTIVRKVAVQAITVPLFNVGVGAVSNISWTGGGNGQNIGVDSYNSYNTNYSVNGEYPNNPSMTESNGDVASQYGFVNFANQQINGNLYLGPDATTSSTTSNNVTGTVDYNYNVDFPQVTMPTNANNWFTAVPVSVSVTNKNGHVNPILAYDFTAPGGNYIVNQDLPVIVEAGATAILNVTASTWSGSGMTIYGSVTPTGPGNAGTAIVYFNGPSSVTISGNTAVNPNTRPENLWYYGMSSLTSITYGGTSSFVGVIYAPSADMTLNGGGSSIDFSGSLIVNSISDKGHYNIHYDESLAQHGPSKGFVAYAWQEL